MARPDLGPKTSLAGGTSMSGGELIAFHSAAAISKHPHGRTHAGGRQGEALPSGPPPPPSSTKAPVFKKPPLSSPGCLAPSFICSSIMGL